MASENLNMLRLKQLMTTVNNQWSTGHTKISDYTSMYFEWTKLFQHFGNAVAVAFKDITDKANTINEN